MDIRNRQALRHEAEQALSQASYDPRRLVVIHTAITMGASALVMLINFLLSTQIEGTGGLSGLGMRAVLSTAQTVLQLGLTILLPFWQMGLTYCILRIARTENVDTMDLRAGFSRVGPILRQQLLQLGLYFLIGMLSANIGSSIYFFSSFSDGLMEKLMAINEQFAADPNRIIDDATMALLVEEMIPMVVITLVVYAAILIPVMYRLRMSAYALMDDDRPGAIESMRISGRLMRGNRFQVFRLDLSFWWFFLLQGMTILLCYADVLLPMIGISLPGSASVWSLICYLVYAVAQVALYWWAGARVETTYAVAYCGLRQMRQPLKASRETPD